MVSQGVEQRSIATTAAIGEETDLRTKAVAKSTNFGEALVLQILKRQLDDRVDIFLGVRILAVGALGEPLHDIQTLR